MVKRSTRHRVFGSLWRVLTVAGLVVGIGTLAQGKGGLLQGRVFATGRPTSPPSREALEAGHETRDINVRATSYILLGIGLTTAFAIGVVFVMIWRFNVDRREAWSKLTPQQTARIVPPAPHLQRNPFQDLARVRAHEQRLLHGYGWTSADHSYAHIPIDRAMKLMVGKSLDVAP